MSLEPRNYLEGSWVITGIRRCQVRWNSIATRLSRRLMTATWIRDWIAMVTTTPLRVSGFVVVVAVLTNLGCLWAFGKEDSVLGNLLRMVLLALGFVGLSDASDWATVSQSSWVVKRLRKII